VGRLGVLFVTPWYPTEAQPAAGVFVREHAQAVRRHGDCDVVVVHGPSIRTSSSRRWSLTEERDASLTGGIPTFRLTHRRLPLPRSGFASYVWSVARAYRAIVADGFAPTSSTRTSTRSESRACSSAGGTGRRWW